MVFSSDLRALMFLCWVILSVVITFTVLIWQPSTGARLNLFDLWVTLPSLVLLAPHLFKSGALRGRALIPLWGFIALVLLSLLWADQPDVSKTLRGAIQAIWSWRTGCASTPGISRRTMVGIVTTLVRAGQYITAA